MQLEKVGEINEMVLSRDLERKRTSDKHLFLRTESRLCVGMPICRVSIMSMYLMETLAKS